MARLIPYLFVFAGLVLAVIGLPGVYDTLEIAMDAKTFVEVEARVLSNSVEKHAKGPSTIDVKFEFATPDGRRVKGDNRYTRLSDDPEDIDQMIRREGGVDRIQVWYDPENPRRAVITKEMNLMRPIGILAVVLLGIFGGLQAILVDKRRRALQARGDEARRRKEEERARLRQIADSDR